MSTLGRTTDDSNLLIGCEGKEVTLNGMHIVYTLSMPYVVSKRRGERTVFGNRLSDMLRELKIVDAVGVSQINPYLLHVWVNVGLEDGLYAPMLGTSAQLKELPGSITRAVHEVIKRTTSWQRIKEALRRAI